MGRRGQDTEARRHLRRQRKQARPSGQTGTRYPSLAARCTEQKFEKILSTEEECRNYQARGCSAIAGRTRSATRIISEIFSAIGVPTPSIRAAQKDHRFPVNILAKGREDSEDSEESGSEDADGQGGAGKESVCDQRTGAPPVPSLLHSTHSRRRGHVLGRICRAREAQPVRSHTPPGGTSASTHKS